MTTSRHTVYSTRKLPHDKRVIKLYGEHEDKGVYYGCWNCGFVMDSDRDAYGDGNSRHGITYSEYAIAVADRTHRGDLNSVTPSLDGAVHYQVAMENGADGNPQDVVHYYKPVVGTGCPFCGTLNWK